MLLKIRDCQKSDNFHAPKYRSRPAVAAIELAVVLPLVLLFTLACTDLGRAVHLKIALSNATRVGAEYGSMRKVTAINRDDWIANVQQVVTADLQATPAFSEIAALVQVDTEAAELGLYRVKVQAQCDFETAVDWPGIPHQIDLQSSVVMLRSR